MEQSAHQHRFADWTRGADRYPADHAVDPEQQEFEPARALLAAFEIDLEGGGEQADQPLDVVDERQRIGKMAFDRKRGYGQSRRDRLLEPTQRLVQALDELSPEPADEGRARPVHDRSNGTQAHAFEARLRLAIDPQRRQRQADEEIALVAVSKDLAAGEAGGGPGSTRGRGKAGTDVETLVEETHHEIVEQCLFAAKQMGTA